MAMLAQPRRKQKVVNLRGDSAWSKDTSKFGQRMLERMGWAPGKGLGTHEDGVTVHVVARYKNDDHGLGYNDRNDQWTQHEDSFESLLAGLRSNASVAQQHTPASLEQRSKKSRARVHYHKFTRGKDLSQYSEKDLANIFGKKSLKNEEVENRNSTIQESGTMNETLGKFEREEEDSEEELKNEHQPHQMFTCGGNMDDYFTSKLRALGRSDLAGTMSSSSPPKENEHTALQDLAQMENNRDHLLNFSKKSKKKKKRPADDKTIHNSLDTYHPQEISATENNETVSKKKIEKKKCDSQLKVQYSDECDFIGSVNTKKKKKSKVLENLTTCDFIDNYSHSHTRKKKKRSKILDVTPCVDNMKQGEPLDNAETLSEALCLSDSAEKVKKRKKRMAGHKDSAHVEEPTVIKKKKRKYTCS